MNNVITQSKGITNSEELLQEKARLEALLKLQRTQIQDDFLSIKEEFRPVINLSSVVGKMFSHEDDKHPVLSAGTNITIDLITQALLSKSNFLVKIILPVILKNLSSHYMHKAAPVLKKVVNGNGKDGRHMEGQRPAMNR